MTHLQIAGVWHTAVVVRGMEYFYGGGVQIALAGSTPYGHPVEIIDLGYTGASLVHSVLGELAHPCSALACMHCRETHVPQEVLDEYITEVRQVFTPQAYNLFQNNCNNFSNELSSFLTGQAIPVSTPLGLHASASPVYDCRPALNTAWPCRST